MVGLGFKLTAMAMLSLSFGVVGAPLSAATAKTWADIVAAAEAEGVVSVIGPPIQPHRQTIERFREAYPKIKLEFSGLTPGQFEPRIDAERTAGKYLWDFVISGVSSVVYSRYIPAGWYSPVRDLINDDLKRDDIWLGGFDSGFLDNQKKYIFAFAAGKVASISVDRSQIPESELNSVEDLLDPKFKGKIAWLDPRDQGSGHLSAAVLMQVLGEDKLKYLLAEQRVVLTNSPRQLAEWITRGRFPISIGAPPNEIMSFQDLGIGKQVKPLPLPPKLTAVSPAWGAIGYLDKAPHPNAARVFLNWLLSTNAQADWAQRGRANSRRTDVPSGFPPLAITTSEWQEGLNLNTESGGPVSLRAKDLAKEVLR